MVVDSSNSRLFFATLDYQIKVYNLPHRCVINTLKGHSDIIWIIELSKDERYLFSGGNDNRIIIWDVAEGCRKVHSIDHGAPVMTLFISLKNDYVYYGGSRDQTVKRSGLKDFLEEARDASNKLFVNDFVDNGKKFNSFNENINNINLPILSKQSKPNESIKSGNESESQRALNKKNGSLFKSQKASTKEKKKDLIKNLEKEKQKNAELSKKNQEYANMNLSMKKQMAYLEEKEKELKNKVKNFEKKQSRISMDFQNEKQKNKDFGTELVQMIGKYNTLLKEKNVINGALTQCKTKLDKNQLETQNQANLILALRRENSNLKAKIKEFVQMNINQNTSKDEKAIEVQQKVLIAQNSELEKTVNDLQETIEQNEKDIKYFKNIIESLKNDISNLEQQNKKKVEKGLLGDLPKVKNNKYFEKLMKMMEQEIGELRVEKQKLETKNKLLTSEFYTLTKKDGEHKTKIKSLVADLKFLQDHINFYKVKNNEYKQNMQNINKVLSLKPAQNIDLSKFKFGKGRKNRYVRPKSLPSNKKPQMLRPVNVYINNHVLPGSGQEQQIELVKKDNSSGSRKTIKNRLASDVWNTEF